MTEPSWAARATEVVSAMLELLGVAIIAVGVVVALGGAVGQVRDASRRAAAYQQTRQQIARSVLLGLELLVASDIVHTVTTTLTFASVGVLALVVLVRTFLALSLTVEIEGRWPWQRRVRS